MIRCSECTKLDKIPLSTKTLYYCFQQRMEKENGIWGCKLWERVPRTHPRWCPLWKESKNAEPREH